jgi:hypothetical protein
MNVVFVEPAFPPTQRHFARALAETGANVVGIGERPGDWLDDELRGWLSEYHQIDNVTDVGHLTDFVRWVQSRMWVDRLETTIEAHTLPVARYGSLHDPRHQRPDGLAVPGQAVDEAGAAGGGRADRRPPPPPRTWTRSTRSPTRSATR